MTHPRTKHGFTLIEISIVLVIIGLLVGSILVGRELIHAAEIRKVISEKQDFFTAIYAFKNKYSCSPGDCAKAYIFFGAACGDATTDPTTGCNGNGDELIYQDTDGIRGEYLKAWLHLSLANLISGTYSGRGTIQGGTNVVLTNGDSLPHSALNSMVWNYTYCDDALAPYNGDLMNSLCIGGLDAAHPQVVQNMTTIPLIDAYNIDKKLDDGLAQHGKVRGQGDSYCTSDDYFGGNPPATPGCSLTFFQ